MSTSNLAASLPLLAAIRSLVEQLPDAGLRKRLEGVLDGKAPAEPEVQKKVVSGDEAARILGSSRRLVQKLASQGKIKIVKLPGRQLALGYLRESVEALAAGEVRTAG